MEPVQQIIEILKERYPDAVCALGYAKDYQLMIAVRLSAQCTDARVNLVTPALFERFPTLESFAEATPEEVEQQLRAILPPEESSDFCHRIVLFGRDTCTARNPACGDCPLRPFCKKFHGE